MSASSWQLPSVEKIMSAYGVIITYVNMCACSMTASDEDGVGYVAKPTKFMTNSPAIAEKLASQCSNKTREGKHRHVHLVNGRARKAQVYPPALCKAICEGLRDQKRWDEKDELRI